MRALVSGSSLECLDRCTPSTGHRPYGGTGSCNVKLWKGGSPDLAVAHHALDLGPTTRGARFCTTYSASV